MFKYTLLVSLCVLAVLARPHDDEDPAPPESDIRRVARQAEGGGAQGNPMAMGVEMIASPMRTMADEAKKIANSAMEAGMAMIPGGGRQARSAQQGPPQGPPQGAPQGPPPGSPQGPPQGQSGGGQMSM